MRLAQRNLLAKGVHVLLEDAVAHVLEVLLRAALVHHPPAVRMPIGVELELFAAAPRIQAEDLVEALGFVELRHAEHEAVH